MPTITVKPDKERRTRRRPSRLCSSFSVQGLHMAQAKRCAVIQRRSARRLGGNDAWLVAAAETLDADVVGADRRAFERLGPRYLQFTRADAD